VNIFGTNRDIQNRKTIYPTAFSAALGEKSSVNFGPLITEINVRRQFIHLLAATLKNSHVENSKNHKSHYIVCVLMLFLQKLATGIMDLVYSGDSCLRVGKCCLLHCHLTS